MITKEEAYRIVLEASRATGTEAVNFQDSAGRILAENVQSDNDIPPFNRSAVDGYACRKEDIDSELEITEVIPAGKEPEKRIGNKQCAKIMTGAIMPQGSDFVVMVEYSEILPSGKVIFKDVPEKNNFSLQGEDLKKGDVILWKSKFIKPQDIAVLASAGHTTVIVARRPSIGIISTGDELVEPDMEPGKSQIRNSNSYQLIAQAERTGASAKYYGIAPDDENRTFELISRAISETDLVLITGGVSMGDFDFVPAVLRRSGVTILFDQVNVQPGKPTTFGTHKDAIIFGLPGNPVSAFIQFETLVRPLVYRMMGHDWKPYEQKLQMAVRYERKSTSRSSWIPVLITEDNKVLPSEYHGSAHITAFPYADGIISMAPGISVIEKDEVVNVRNI